MIERVPHGRASYVPGNGIGGLSILDAMDDAKCSESIPPQPYVVAGMACLSYSVGRRRSRRGTITYRRYARHVVPDGERPRRGRDRYPHDWVPEWLRTALSPEIGLVGKGPARYNLYVGAAFDGSRLSKLYAEDLDHAGIIAKLAPLFAAYAAQRKPGERVVS
jgi:hypothetical protein